MLTYVVIDKATGATVWSGKATDREHAMRHAAKKIRGPVTHHTHLVRRA